MQGADDGNIGKEVSLRGAAGDVAIPGNKGRSIRSPENRGDCQKVKCHEGAREATLGCASVRTGSQ